MGKMILNGKEYAGSGSEWYEYSTDENVVGKWIDGKPLYQKVITGTYSYTTDNMGDFYVGYLNLSSIIPNIDMAWVDVNKSYYTIGTVYRGFIAGWYQKDSNEFMLMTRFSRSNVSSVIVIQYTKITD